MIPHILAYTALISGTLTDFDRREVPHYITQGLIAAGMLYAIHTAILTQNITPVLRSLGAVAIAYAIGALMYYTGQWGGADGLMIMGIGAVHGLGGFFTQFMILSLFSGAIYGVGYLLYLGIRHYKTLHKHAKKPHKALYVARLLVIVFLVLAILIDSFILRFTSGILIFTYLTYSLYKLAKLIEEHIFTKPVQVDKLVEGDWIAEDVNYRGKTLIEADKLKTGLELHHIELLKEKNIQHVIVKEGIPFVPSFLLAYVLAYVAGPYVSSLFATLF